jgi:hypothetical protein
VTYDTAELRIPGCISRILHQLPRHVVAGVFCQLLVDFGLIAPPFLRQTSAPLPGHVQRRSRVLTFRTPAFAIIINLMPVGATDFTLMPRQTIHRLTKFGLLSQITLD